MGGAPSCEVWGVLNVTPDSFSDGGRFLAVDAALAHARALLDDGANVIDVGGESTRPPGKTYGRGATPVRVEDELRRVVPVIEALASETTVSVDTKKAEVARAALAAGARIVNDVSGGESDALLDAVARADASLVLMHSRKDGALESANTRYEDVVADVLEALLDRAARAEGAGIGRDKIWIDPGIGFAKTAAQSARLLGNLDAFVASGYPVLVGASRKSFIAQLHGVDPPPDKRIGGSVAAVTAAVMSGCRAVRVHDVYESAQAVRVASAMRSVPDRSSLRSARSSAASEEAR